MKTVWDIALENTKVQIKKANEGGRRRSDDVVVVEL